MSSRTGLIPSCTAPKESLRKSSLRIEELPTIAMNGLQPVGTPNNAVAASPGSGLLTPIPNGTRRTPSAENLRTDSSHLNGTTSSPSAASPSSTAAENSPAGWSSAIGHATTSGKSGRVIERLMTENDKLKRDLNAQMIKCQELEKSLQTYKPQMEALRQENDNLSHARGVDSSLISRRDRKIEELKADLTGERERREKAEALARQRETEKEAGEEQSRREIQSMAESTKHSTVHAEILETSHKQLAAEYRARAEAWKKDLSAVADAREQDRQKLARLDVVADQMRQELERTKKLNGDVVEAWERLREESDGRVRGIVEENEREEETSRKLSTEMDKVVKEMRWVMGVQKNVKDA